MEEEEEEEGEDEEEGRKSCWTIVKGFDSWIFWFAIYV